MSTVAVSCCWNCGRSCGVDSTLCAVCIEGQRQSKFRDLAAALCTMPRGTLWCVGSMEDGPFARICYPMPGGGYGGGYCEETADTPADALWAALAAGTRKSRDAEQARAEGCQSGPKGNAQGGIA